MTRDSSKDSIRNDTTTLNAEAESFNLKFGDESNDVINRGSCHTPSYYPISNRNGVIVVFCYAK